MEIILSLFSRHGEPINERLVLDALGMAYLSTWIRCDSLRLDKLSHDMKPSFHLQQMSEPAVDFLMVSLLLTATLWSSMLRSKSFFLWSTNVSNKSYLLPLLSHWAYIDSAIKLAANSVILPQETPLNKDIYPEWGLIGSTNWIIISTMFLMYHSAFPLLVVQHLNIC